MIGQGLKAHVGENYLMQSIAMLDGREINQVENSIDLFMDIGLGPLHQVTELLIPNSEAMGVNVQVGPILQEIESNNPNNVEGVMGSDSILVIGPMEILNVPLGLWFQRPRTLQGRMGVL